MTYVVTYDQHKQALEQGKLLGVRCRACGAVAFPPLGVCRDCSGSDLEPVEMGGGGVLRTFTVIRVAPEGRKPPYVIAMVELDEGPWVIGNLVDVDPDGIDLGLIGRRVSLGGRKIQGDTFSAGDMWVVTFALQEPRS